MNHWTRLGLALDARTGSPIKKAVLLAITKHCNAVGETFVSQETIAWEVECSSRTVRRALDDLEADGMVTRKARGKPGGGRTTDLYQVHIEGKPDNLSGKGKPDRESGSNRTESPGVLRPQKVKTPEEAPLFPEGEYSSTIDIDPPLPETGCSAREARSGPETGGTAKRPTASASPDDVAKAVEAWNALAKRAPELAAVLKLTDQRKKALAARLRDDGGLDAWNLALRNIEASTFLRKGSGKDRPWTASFDWLLKPSNFVKVIEGNYNRGKGGGVEYLPNGGRSYGPAGYRP